MSDNIKVVVKVRPLIPREIEEKLSYQWRVKNNTLYQLDQQGRDLGQAFTFDQVYDQDTKTSDVYNDIAKPIVEAATAGFNGTIFAYGQTSSGKTYTMTGTEDSPGIIPLAIVNLFEIIRNIPDRDFLVRVSYMEIYNETIKDLLDVEKDNMKIHETLQGIKVDATEKMTSSPEEVLDIMKQGEANRQTGSTNMNETSSRSHSIFQITIESREHMEGSKQVGCVNVSQLNLVDLAGSERAGQTGAKGLRFKEGTHINKSLSALALVIKQLSEGPNKYANYRDSKLTRLLQNSLGGNAKTSIICAVTPAAVEETISTLQFANRAKAIKNKPEVNAVATDATMIQQLTKQLSKLQMQLETKKNLEIMLETKKNVEQDNYNLQKQIAALQRLFLNGFGSRDEPRRATGRPPPRRVTISTLHAIHDEPPQVPKFCTPLLKYNPMLLPSSSDFVPIQNLSKLPTLPEESRLITPPPIERRVNISDEIIELDSDDDCKGSCSPYHKCFSHSKTPPCVLRKNAKLAEKNLKDIVELTEREKIYTPHVVELMEKIEENTNVIAKLQDEVNSLRQQGQDKDSQMDQLKNLITNTEYEVKQITLKKLELEAQCKEFNTKLTDWEVIYETFKNKAKLREEELLSLLDEKKNFSSKPRTLENELSQFMDMSKDISLVNSDNESSIINTLDDGLPTPIKDIVTDLQAQLTMKTQSVIELEANLFAHQQKIASIENTTCELNTMVSNLQDKLQLYENENALLKSTLDNLNSTINTQKSSLEAANSDIKSYNNVLEELQIKLTQKDSLLNVNINESLIETMITNEEQFIANNENMKNIIYTFKNTLNERNKEIDQLKSTIENNSVLLLNSNNLKGDLDANAKLINTLNDEIKTLNQQLDGNVATISLLTQDKSKLQDIESDLTTKLATIEDKNKELEEMYKQKELYIENLKENYDKLVLSVEEKDEKGREMTRFNEDLLNKIANLEKEISNKETLIESYSQKEEEAQDNIHKAKSAIDKLQSILNIISGDIQECPNAIENIISMLSTLCNNLNSLEIIVKEVVAEKDSAAKANIALKEELEQLTKKKIINIEDNLNKMANKELESEALLKQITDLTSELNNIKSELSEKNTEIDVSKQELAESMESYESLRKELIVKSDEICTLKERNCRNLASIEGILEERDEKFAQFENEIRNLQDTLKSKEVIFNETLIDKEKRIAELTISLSEIDSKVEEKLTQLRNTSDKIKATLMERDAHIKSIFERVSQITQDCCIENNLSCEFQNVNINIYEQIRLTLDKVANHILFIKDTDSESDTKIESILSEAKVEIRQLTDQNLSLINKCTMLETNNQEMSKLLEQIQNDNQNLKQTLLGSNATLELLKQELNIKAQEIEQMQSTANNWKEKFVNMEFIMQQRFDEIKLENGRLTEKILRVNKNSLQQSNQISDVQGCEVEECDESSFRRSISNSSQLLDLNSPPSLLTICCNKIIDHLQPRDDESDSVTSSTDRIAKQDTGSQVDICQCIQLSLELSETKDEMSKLLNILSTLELVNQQLLLEQEEVRKEVAMLLKPANELQKKIATHKTNLSILTATTYAENKSLQSQVTALQHHHRRFHNVCQRDIPDFKNKLRELMTILNLDPALASAHNASFKRYSLPDVLDNNSTFSNLKNESTLDGDLLMLDTNITLMSTDNTLTGHDQTCLDITQSMYREVSCQTNERINQQTESKDHSQKLIADDLLEELRLLKEENVELKERIQISTRSKTDALSSPIRMDNSHNQQLVINLNKNCEDCVTLKDLRSLHDTMVKELDLLSQELLDVKTVKEEIEEKYKNLVLEIPSTENLVKKLTTLEAEYNCKVQENTKLTNALNNKCKQIKQLQDENDSLSTQVMENITEADDLNKELERLKEINKTLNGKYEHISSTQRDNASIDTRTWSCSQCSLKENLMHSLPTSATSIGESHSKLNRSYSDSDSSSRHNKICTLQSELHAGREDCKELSKEVTTIKKHLERSNMSMDLDESVDEVTTFPLKCSMPYIPEESSDAYIADKMDCLNYYSEKANVDRENLSCDIKILDIMKMFYNDLIVKHGNEVDNLVNKLKDFEESKAHLQTQIDKMTQDYHNTKKELRENIKSVTNFVSEIKNNSKELTEDIADHRNSDKTGKLVGIFKENLLKILDFEFGLSSVSIFDYLIENVSNIHQRNLGALMVRYSELQKHLENITTELNAANENVHHLKLQLSDKEKEFNLMKVQKERVQEISNAVTLDIVKREEECNKLIIEGCQKLVRLNILKIADLDLNSPLSVNINLLFEYLFNHLDSTDVDKEKEYLLVELDNLKTIVAEKDKYIEETKIRNEKLQEINCTVTLDLVAKEKAKNETSSLYADLLKIYNSKVEENQTNLILTENLTEEIALLKEATAKKDLTIQTLVKDLEVQKNKTVHENDHQIVELRDTVARLREEITNLKKVNDMIAKEKQEYASELEKSGETIKRNATELDKMTSDILILRESVRETDLVVKNLKQEASSLLKQNLDLKILLEQKSLDCSRLATNIKTHEKTAEIQSRMIIRLQKLKDDDDKAIKEKEQLITELSEKYTSLQGDYETLQNTIKTHKNEIDVLTTAKDNLEARISDLMADKETAQNPRASLDTIADSSRRRRQSLYDSKRFFDRKEFEDQNNMEAVFEGRSKPDDLFMDVDDDMSNRSTPIRLSRGRDSLLSRTNPSDKEEDQQSRPSSVVATRKRRQSSHDLHRSIIRHTPSPHEMSTRLTEETNHVKSDPSNNLSADSEVHQLRKQLSSCQLELEELREKYRELDEECETCAQYLAERDQQCSRLKKEKSALENTMKELQEKLLVNKHTSYEGEQKSVAHVSVNTDEDWANLHAVVVDRMSYDAEVEKNKRLTKCIDELRFKKQELKNTIGKMQKALDKYSGKDNRELEATKQELESCREELEELRQRCKELDEECETCAEYLRERDQQCRRLKEAKANLEAKLQELQEDAGLRDVMHSSRKKRQSTHDQNRSTSVELVDAATETSEDFLSYQVEKDSSRHIAEDTHTKEIKRLRMTIEKLSQQKLSLEEQLVSAASAPVCVATGSAIVQNQQLTDVMKENQKLKKINNKLINICKKRGRGGDSNNQENVEPSEQG